MRDSSLFLPCLQAPATFPSGEFFRWVSGKTAPDLLFTGGSATGTATVLKELASLNRPRNLLVGYGTLLSRESTAKTVGSSASTKPFEPVVVMGFRRLFNLRPDHYRPSFHLSDQPLEVTAMNVIPWEGSWFNGLAFSVSPDDLAALDTRERYYQRVRVPVLAFPRREPLGDAWVYSAPSGAPAVISSDSDLRPQWEDLLLARTGAYAKGEDFGKMFDETTFMPDGRTLVVNAYGAHLPPLGQP